MRSSARPRAALVHSPSVTELRPRLTAAVATFSGLLAGGFDAHVAPQSGGGTWHGLTGSPSTAWIAFAVAAAAAVWALGAIVNVRPMIAMALGLLPLVAAITGVAPLLLVLSGYTDVLLLAILLAVTTRDLASRASALTLRSTVPVAFIVFILVGGFLPGPAGPQGDEPHYLLIAESLLRDGDVDLKNQFDERAFSKFTSASLEPHTAPRSPKDTIYALHTPGLAALVAPGYAALGYAGARAVIAAVIALAIGLLCAAARTLFGAEAAGIVFVVATFASPLPIYANAVFPDSVATLPVAATLAFLAMPTQRHLFLATLSIATLPWIHPRFLPLGLLLAAAISVHHGFAWRRALATFAPLAISLGLLLLHFRSIFGSASLSAAYGPGFRDDVSIMRIPWGGTALLFDRQFGLLLFAPVLLLALGGIGAAMRRDRLIGATSGAAAAAFVAIGGAFSMWWGGASAPARFVIGAMPALLLLLGALWASSADRPERRRSLAAAAGFGAGLLILACMAPRALHNRADGDSGLLRLLAPSLDVDRAFPGFVTNAAGVTALAILWLVALVAMMSRSRLGRTVVLAPFVFAAVAPSSRPFVDSFSASLRLLESWESNRKAFGGDDRREAFALDVPLGAKAWTLAAGTTEFSPRFSLPPGNWTMTVASRSEPSTGAVNLADVDLVAGTDDATPLATSRIRVDEASRTVAFSLDRPALRLRLRGRGLQAEAVIEGVRLSPAPSPR